MKRNVSFLFLTGCLVWPACCFRVAGQTVTTTLNALCSSGTLYAADYTPKGKFGALYAAGASYAPPLRYREYDLLGAAGVDESVVAGGVTQKVNGTPALVYDAQGTAHVFSGTDANTLRHLWRTGGAWQAEDLGDVAPYTLTVRAARGATGTFHIGLVRACYTLCQDKDGVLVFHGSQGAWSREEFGINWDTNRYFIGFDLAAAADNSCHIVYSLQERLGNDVYWNAELYYRVLRSDVWSTTLVSRRAERSLDTAYHEPDIEVNSGGVPSIATHLRFNVITGSDARSELVYFFLAGSTWNGTTLAATADNYFGSDGGNHAGWHPCMALDGWDAAHIVFSDLASWHDIEPPYMTASIGQIRYARQSGSSWPLATLYVQSAQAMEGINESFITVSSDGRIRVVFLKPRTRFFTCCAKRPNNRRFRSTGPFFYPRSQAHNEWRPGVPPLEFIPFS